MPGKDGTGPLGRGKRRGLGKGRGSQGKGRRAGSRKASCGLSGECLCPSCGRTVAHKPGVPCSSMMCPWCFSGMIRA